MEDKLLHLLSRLEPNQKICLKDESIIESGSWTSSFYRYWKDENREDLLLELRKVIDHLPKYPEETISQALQGLNNLLITYESDPFFCHEIILLGKEFEVYVKKSFTKKEEEPFIPLLHGHKPILVIGVECPRNLSRRSS